MSGGSWGYAYSRVEDVAERLMLSGDLNRRALGLMLRRAAVALRAVEWVDSGDYGPEKEEEAMRAVLLPADRLDAATGAARAALDDLRAVLDEVTP